MATGGRDEPEIVQWSPDYSDNLDLQNDEIFACQSFFYGEEERRFNLIHNGPDEAIKGNTDLFSVQFLVPVRLPKSEITVNICIATEENFDPENIENIIHVVGSYPLKFLTPLKLLVVLPPEYPSSAPPIFTLSSSWLTGDQLTALCSQLDMLWQECPSMPILNTWIDWLEHNTLSHLNIEDCVNIQVSNGDSSDPRAINECKNVEDTADAMFRYNRQEETLDFIQHDQECPVCFSEMPGREFYKLCPCSHYFCKECVAAYCSVHVKDGTVQELVCLEPKCKTEISPSIIKEILDEDAFERWERLTFQRGLDMMGDITYCPQCQAAVVKEENALNLAQCMVCGFSFCMECSEPVHPGEQCFFKRKPDKEKKTDPSKDTKEMLRLRMKQTAEIESRKLIKQRAKNCPSCSVPIVKISGCNKVTCTQCHNSMCWSCGANITSESYQHFRKSEQCGMWTFGEGDIPLATKQKPLEVLQIEMDVMVGRIDTLVKLVGCVKCGEQNIREDNNHIICWNCHIHFCFLCNKKLSPPYTRHFTKTKCKQYGDITS